jgi:hypothetical protein
MVCTVQQTLFGLLNKEGYNGQSMWQAWGTVTAYNNFAGTHQ